MHFYLSVFCMAQKLFFNSYLKDKNGMRYLLNIYLLS